MSPIAPHFRIDAAPVAAPTATVVRGNARFTVLTPRLLRLEWSPTGRFCDRASQPFWYRRQPVPPFSVAEEEGVLVVETAALRLAWRLDAAGFEPAALAITLLENGTTWRYGDADLGNLRGTFRTLDRIDGPVDLEPGLLSRDGWVVVDDSQTLVFDERGWLAPREPAGGQDLYFFGHGRDFRGALRDFARVSGPAPLLPRWALGNWWSRYWAYDAGRAQGACRRFPGASRSRSRCASSTWIGTSSHTGRSYAGWTGYTWNRELFPDPDGLILAWLHAQGLRTALNLHPADGVRPHEAQYPAVARRLGV